MHRQRKINKASHQLQRFASAVAALALAISFIMPAPALAVTPNSMLIEGRLAKADGGATSDGDYGLTFSLYASKTAQTPFWQEKGVLVSVKGGWFHHTLGSKTPLAVGAISTKTAVWLGMNVGAEAELTRQPLRSTTTALVAATTSSLQCSGCVTSSAMKFSDNVDLGSYSLKTKNVTATTVTAVTVQGQSFVGDGSKLSGLTLPSGSCPSGKVLVGINADGTLKCATTAASLPKDGLDEISNGVLKNQFVETFSIPAKDVGKAIPDATGVDLVSTITVPNIGTTESFFKVTVDLQNSDLSQVSIVLLPPNDKKTGITLCDPCGKKYEKVLKTAFPTPQATKTGDLKQWIGKNPAGTWNLKVTDAQFCVPQLDKINCNVTNVTDGKLNSWSLSTQVLSNSKAQVTGDLVVTGKLILPNKVVEETYPLFPKGCVPFIYGSSQDRLGSNYSYVPFHSYAYQVPTSGAGLHALTQRVVYADQYGNFTQQRGGASYPTYDRSQQYLFAFIKNSTGADISHKLNIRFSSRSSGSNYAGVAVDKKAYYNYTSNSTTTTTVTVVFPKNHTSVLVLKAGAHQYTSYGNHYYYRSVIGYYNNSFKLPAGLSFDYARYDAWHAGK